MQDTVILRSGSDRLWYITVNEVCEDELPKGESVFSEVQMTSSINELNVPIVVVDQTGDSFPAYLGDNFQLIHPEDSRWRLPGECHRIRLPTKELLPGGKLYGVVEFSFKHEEVEFKRLHFSEVLALHENIHMLNADGWWEAILFDRDQSEVMTAYFRVLKGRPVAVTGQYAKLGLVPVGEVPSKFYIYNSAPGRSECLYVKHTDILEFVNN